MKSKITKWSVIKFFKERENIQFPDYQREPDVWGDDKKSKLIDSIIRGIPIPPIFLLQQNENEFDCIDGQQRLQSIFSFFDGELVVEDYGFVDNISERTDHLIEKIKECEIPVVIIDKETEDSDLRELFRRLQLGQPLNAGEKLNSLVGKMKDFIFDTAKTHPFLKKINIPQRRFSKEQMFAQICINSFSISIYGPDEYRSARYEKLLSFFEQYQKLDKFDKEISLIKKTLDLLDKHFDENSRNLDNRAYILSAYLFVENLIRNNRSNEIQKFVEFYLKFIEILKQQARKGLDYDKKYRRLLEFYKYVTAAAFEPYSIRNRNEIISEFFSHYQKTGKIKENRQ